MQVKDLIVTGDAKVLGNLRSPNIDNLQAQVDDLRANPASSFTYGTTDLTAGQSPLAEGALYFVYE